MIECVGSEARLCTIWTGMADYAEYVKDHLLRGDPN